MNTSDAVVAFFENNAKEILEMSFLSHVETPSTVNSVLQNRFLKPAFINEKIKKRFPEIRIFDDKNLHYDWEIFKRRISNKQQAGFFSRPFKNRPHYYTKGKEVQLINIGSNDTTKSLSHDDFDYLFLLETPIPGESAVFSLSLMPIETVINELAKLPNGGRRGGGQILFIPKIEQCCVHAALSQDEIRDLEIKYAEKIAVPTSVRNEVFKNDLGRLFESQATLHTHPVTSLRDAA